MDESCHTDSDNLFVGTVNKNHGQTKTEIKKDEYFVMLDIQDTPMRFKVDTGSQANIIPVSMYRKLKEPKAPLQTSKTSLTSYTGDKLHIIGKCTLKCMNKHLNFLVSETNQSPILGFQASQKLEIIKVVLSAGREHDVKAKYSNVFEGLGRMFRRMSSRSQHIAPVVNPARKVPVTIKDRLKAELEEMEKKGVIRKVDVPTDWVNSIAIVEKPGTGKLRICLDPKHLTQAIKREHYQLPTVEEIATRVSGAKVFSKL